MRKGDQVTARTGSREVHGTIQLTTKIDGEEMFYVVYEGGTCWFNAPLLRPYTPHQLMLF